MQRMLQETACYRTLLTSKQLNPKNWILWNLKSKMPNKLANGKLEEFCKPGINFSVSVADSKTPDMLFCRDRRKVNFETVVQLHRPREVVVSARLLKNWSTTEELTCGTLDHTKANLKEHYFYSEGKKARHVFEANDGTISKVNPPQIIFEEVEEISLFFNCLNSCNGTKKNKKFEMVIEFMLLDKLTGELLACRYMVANIYANHTQYQADELRRRDQLNVIQIPTTSGSSVKKRKYTEERSIEQQPSDVSLNGDSVVNLNFHLLQSKAPYIYETVKMALESKMNEVSEEDRKVIQSLLKQNAEEYDRVIVKQNILDLNFTPPATPARATMETSVDCAKNEHAVPKTENPSRFKPPRRSLPNFGNGSPTSPINPTQNITNASAVDITPLNPGGATSLVSSNETNQSEPGVGFSAYPYGCDQVLPENIVLPEEVVNELNEALFRSNGFSCPNCLAFLSVHRDDFSLPQVDCGSN